MPVVAFEIKGNCANGEPCSRSVSQPWPEVRQFLVSFPFCVCGSMSVHCDAIASAHTRLLDFQTQDFQAKPRRRGLVVWLSLPTNVHIHGDCLQLMCVGCVRPAACSVPHYLIRFVDHWMGSPWPGVIVMGG